MNGVAPLLRAGSAVFCVLLIAACGTPPAPANAPPADVAAASDSQAPGADTSAPSADAADGATQPDIPKGSDAAIPAEDADALVGTDAFVGNDVPDASNPPTDILTPPGDSTGDTQVAKDAVATDTAAPIDIIWGPGSCSATDNTTIAVTTFYYDAWGWCAQNSGCKSKPAAEQQNCYATCLATKSKISGGCATCWGQKLACIQVGDCATACAGGVGTEACTTCLISKCNPALDQCAGGEVCIISADCNDGNPCSTDTCNAGLCKHTTLSDGTNCGTGDACTQKACQAGSCVGQTLPDGTACNDSSACTTGDHCTAGKCAGSGKCDSCENKCGGTSAKAAGGTCDCTEECKYYNSCCSDVQAACGCAADADCDDQSVCTKDTCKNGWCTNAAKTCDDKNPCTVDACDPVGGCVATAISTQTECNDGNDCTTGDKCTAGACKGTGTVADGIVCDDKNNCTAKDKCTGGLCKGDFSASQGDICDDANACTEQDHCQDGACKGVGECGSCVGQCGGASIASDGKAPCMCDGGCVGSNDCCADFKASCECATDGDCSDGNACTKDTCYSGTCQWNPINCNDNSACTLDSCNFVKGCVTSPDDSAGACNDGDACTNNDVCKDGKCGGTAVTCNDGNKCTDDSCKAVGGCFYAPNKAACDDGKACTTGDHCEGGACTAKGGTCPCTIATDCNDSNSCTTDTCTAQKTCSYAALSCDDGNACTYDVCVASTSKCTSIADNSLTPPSPSCTPDDCSVGSAACKDGALTCTWLSADPNKEGKACQKGAGICQSGTCYVNEAPVVTAATFADMPTKPGASAALTVLVADANSDAAKSANDIAAVTIDLSAVGGSNAQALAYKSKGDTNTAGIYTGTVPTAGLAQGVYLLPVSVKDKGGETVKSLAPLYIYTGTLIHVGADQTNTNIKAGIAAAVDGDAVLIHDGTYSGTTNKALKIAGKKIIVISQNGAAKTIIDCQQALSAFNFKNTGETPQTVVANLTIQNCIASGAQVTGDTGGVSTDPTFVGMVFATNSFAGDGGGLLVSGAAAHATVALSTFTGNTSVTAENHSGGAIAVTASAKLTVLSSTFSGNNGYYGGAIYAADGSALTVAESSFIGNSSSGSGAAVYAPGASGAFAMSNCLVKGHTAGSQAVNADRTGTSITGVRFEANSITQAGLGGSDTIVKDCVFSGNSGLGLSVGGGNAAVSDTIWSGSGAGCLSVNSSGAKLTNLVMTGGTGSNYDSPLSIGSYGATISNLTISNNSATNAAGGAISVSTYYSGLTIDGCVLSGNTTGGNGGAIAMNQGSLTLKNCEITNNLAKNGGGISLTSGGMTATNVLIAGNKVSGNGGGLYADVAANLTSVTIANNVATIGGGVYWNHGTQTVGYGIIWGNKATAASAPLGHQVWVNKSASDLKVDIAFTAIAQGSDDDISDDAGKINGETFQDGSFGNLTQDPLFVAGAKGDFYLSQTAAGQAKNSPAVDPVGAGVQKAIDAAVKALTTRTDGVVDSGNLDMGYHFAP